ncbi:MAG: tetraacyldisaccharide 4'-kinase [Gammaproteobacteria bacterium]
MHDWLIATWYSDGRRGRWLLPFGWLFGAVARLRRTLYARGWLPSYRSSRPVVMVGNLTAGGTGKTPLVAWLAERLATRGLRPGIALRGYGGGGGAARRVWASDVAHGAGDEAVLLARRTGKPVATAVRRADAVRMLEPDCDLILCDDGLQHYALARDLEIAVVDGERGLGNGRLLPAGPLREPASRLDQVAVVVVNGCGFQRPGATGMRLEAVAAVALADGRRRALTDFAGRPVVAAAAIGNPARFFALLRAHGIAAEERAFPDHAAFSPAQAGGGAGRALLMTEKDAVKCTGDGWQDAWYVEVEARVAEPGATALVDRIATLAAARPPGIVHRD